MAAILVTLVLSPKPLEQRRRRPLIPALGEQSLVQSKFQNNLGYMPLKKIKSNQTPNQGFLNEDH